MERNTATPENIIEARAALKQADVNTVVIPAHGGNDPDKMNDARSGFAEKAIQAFQSETGADDCDAVSDLICDIMHLCHECPQTYGDFASELKRAAGHFEAETGDVAL